MLLGDLDLNAGPAVAALGKVDAKFTGTMGGLATAGAAAGATFKGIELVIDGVAKVVAMFKETLDLGGTLQDLSLRTGETVGDLVILREAFEESGLGANGVEPFFAKLQDTISGVNEEGKSTAAALKALGTSGEALRGMSGIAQIEALQKGFAGITDQATKVQVARDLLGKSGSSALSLLGDPQVLDDARLRAGPLADIMEKNAGAFDKLGDVVGSLKLNFQEFFAGALSKIAPEATSIAEALGSIDFVGIGEGVGALVDVVLQLVGAFAAVAPLVNLVSEGVSALFGSGSTASAGLAEKYKGFAKLAQSEELSGSSNKSGISALQKIGGGGGFGGGADPMLTEQRRANSLLEKIASAVSPGERYSRTLDPVLV